MSVRSEHSRSRKKWVTLVTRLLGGWDDRRIRLRFPAGADMFPFTTACRPALINTQASTQGCYGLFSVAVKQWRHDSKH
jgi:hypothetical protein